MHVGISPFSTAHRPFQFGQRDDRSGLERAAERVARVRAGRPAVLASLLLAGLPRRASDDCDVLWPAWASEAVTRAEGLLTLLALLDRSRRGGSGRLGRRLDLDLARSLGSHYQTVQAAPARVPVPCSPILRDTAAALVSLFGNVAGGPALRTDIACLMLPGFQRRALVLAASTLVIGALIHGVAAAGTDVLDITLRHDRHIARLQVTVQDPVWAAGPALAAARAMVDLLEGELRLEDAGRRTEIVFPMPPGGR